MGSNSSLNTPLQIRNLIKKFKSPKNTNYGMGDLFPSIRNSENVTVILDSKEYNSKFTRLLKDGSYISFVWEFTPKIEQEISSLLNLPQF